MSDFHFVVRHALTGVILLAFTICGVWLIGIANKNLGDVAPMLLRHILSKDNVVATALVGAPVFGILVQGLYTAIRRIMNLDFTDPARRLIGTRIRELFKKRSYQKAEFGDMLCNFSDDVLFVWLYHEEAPSYMIEWARRRRTYHYLGMNWIIASVLGLLIGLLLPFLVNVSENAAGKLNLELRPEYSTHTMSMVVIGTVVWLASMFYLAQKMKQDADNMELAWIFSRLNPNLKETLSFPDRQSRKNQIIKNNVGIRNRKASLRARMLPVNRP